MSRLVSSFGHAFAIVAQDAVKAKNFIVHTLLPVVQKIEKAEPTIEAITAMIDPAAVNVERVAFAVLGKIAEAVHSADAAATAGGLNIALDSAAIADVKAVLAAFKAKALTMVDVPAKPAAA